MVGWLQDGQCHCHACFVAVSLFLNKERSFIFLPIVVLVLCFGVWGKSSDFKVEEVGGKQGQMSLVFVVVVVVVLHVGI